ncbi:50S ribosomal protein L35 [Paenibacillus sp. GYB003]|uniref:50S ribosomal protein L35 n=1 Tax=Paenibacillus sp. GYB003 TaxID=2994392 RepID=UPI002F969A3B
MPKMKTHSSLKDRVKVTGTGKVRRYKAYKNHLMFGKGKSQKQRLGKSPIMASGDVARLKQQIANLK